MEPIMKKVYFFIDDVIWTFRDLAKDMPGSLFDNPFMKMLKSAHEKYGMKVQINTFYRTDYFYGGKEFNLSSMPDIYKKEWEENSDWLKIAFHARQEFPDYPYVNAAYDDVKEDFEITKAEILRFAGSKSFANAVTPHWLPMSKEACQALADCGVKITSVSTGVRQPFSGNPEDLPYGHAARLLQNRKPETAVFERKSLNKLITKSICSYNHLTESEIEPTLYTAKTFFDEKTGMHFKRLCNGPCFNLSTLDGLSSEFEPILDSEFIGYATHEQYFYPEYYAYQEDYAKKLMKCAEIVTKNGYEYIFAEELV